MRDYKIFSFAVLTDIANELDIDIAELFAQYDFGEEEIEDYYNWFKGE